MSHLFCFVGGTVFGVMIMCCMVSAGRADNREERWFRDK